MRPILTSAFALFATSGMASAQDAVDICLFEEDDPALIISACTEALETAADAEERGRFILHRAIGYEDAGDLDAALAGQIEASELRPDWIAPFQNAGVLSGDMGDADAHRMWAERAIEAEPDNPRAYLELLFLINNGDDPESCVPVAEQVMELLPHPIDWPFMAARSAFLMGNLGYCLETDGRYELAMRAYLAAERHGLDESWLYQYIAGIAYYELEQDERARDYAEISLTFDPPDLFGAEILVGSHVYLDDLDAGIAAYRQYADLFQAAEGMPSTWSFLGWSLLLEDRIEEASMIMEEWVTWTETYDGPNTADVSNAWDTVAQLRAATGDADGASEAFRRVLQTEVDYEGAVDFYRSELAVLGFEVGDGEEGLLAALDACAATGAACRMIHDDAEEEQASE